MMCSFACLISFSSVLRHSMQGHNNLVNSPSSWVTGPLLVSTVTVLLSLVVVDVVASHVLGSKD